jgi:hypothetical protein
MKREMMNMFTLSLRKVSGRTRFTTVPLAVLGMWAMNAVGLAQTSVQPTFPSATDASQRLFQAVQDNQEQDITNILGGPSELASTRDDAQDKADRQLFVEKYREMHRLSREADGMVTLYIGAENWPFPIPLTEKNGAWHFNPDAGLKEVMFRRIGENEFTAIAICHQFVAEEKQYRANPNNANPTGSLPSTLVAMAAGKTNSSEPVPFHGYHFQVLSTRATAGGGKANGGFVFVAYPAEYRSTGVMTFFVTGTGVVFEKDLGEKTPALANATATFHKDSSWRPADQ